MLVVIGGLPATGKTTLARLLVLRGARWAVGVKCSRMSASSSALTVKS